jgi:hypothetical protein
MPHLPPYPLLSTLSFPLHPPPLQAQDSDDEPEEVAGEGGDYLSPFLPSGMGAHQLTRPEALLVREKALAALKDRLVERANIIQVRGQGGREGGRTEGGREGGGEGGREGEQ